MALSASSPTAARLWIRDELFTHGVLHANATDAKKMNMTRLKTILAGVLATDGTPVSSAAAGSFGLGAWETLATGVLRWTAAEARSCFRLFQTLVRCHTAEPAVATSDAVPRLQFAMFLFAQLYSHARAVPPSRQNADASWPETAQLSPSAAMAHPRSPVKSPVRSPGSPTAGSIQSPRALGMVLRSTEQAHRLQFMKTHLLELLQLLFGGEDSTMTRDDFNTLRFLFCGGHSQMAEVADLASLFPEFSKSPKATVSVATAKDWIVACLGVNEIAYPPSGTASSAGTTHTPAVPDAPSTPDSALTPVVSPIIVSGIHKSTVFKTSASRSFVVPPGGSDAAAVRPVVLPDATVENCNDAFVYLLCPVRCVTIVASHNCTVVVGAVSGCLSADICNGVRVVAAAAMLRINNCVDSLFQVFTLQAPIITGDAAPAAGGGAGAGAGALSGSPGAAANLWDKPCVVTSEPVPAAGHPASAPAPFQLLDPSLFFTLIVPLPGTTTAVGALEPPLPMPEKYAAALASKRDSVKALRGMIKDAGLGDASRTELQAAVQAHFRDWLVSSGQVRQVADLVKLHREDAKDRGSVGSSGSAETGADKGV